MILMMQLCLNLKVLKHAIAAGKTNFKNRFASQMWATRPHLGSIFEKLLHRKTFYLPAARISQPILHFAPFCRKYGTPLQFVGNYGTINGKHHRTTPQRGGTA
ncbi:hypothetical protein [Ruminococcus sp.]|uniref:hypothetical protein n=1 Tax=Ruminococcus sp. TaxID=41978 RepID=UPI003991D013